MQWAQIGIDNHKVKRTGLLVELLVSTPKISARSALHTTKLIHLYDRFRVAAENLRPVSKDQCTRQLVENN